VVTEAKPFASLSSGLLARKGTARPAMKPQGFGQMGGGNLEDLGWNDMGFEPPKPAPMPARDEDHDAFGQEVVEHPRAHPTGLTPIHSPVHSQQAELAVRFAAPEAEEIDDTAEMFTPEVVTADVFTPKMFTPEVLEPEPEVAEAPAAPMPALVAVPAEPARQVRAPRPRAAAGSKAKAAFTLRLDPERHLKLRLACAVTGRSAQQLVTDSLDAFLTGMPELNAMAAKANRKG
jgi:hypothetical protein